MTDEAPTHPDGTPITPDFPVQNPMQMPPNPELESEITEDEPDEEEEGE